MRWQIGDVRIDRAVEFEQPLLPPATLLPELDPEMLERHRAWLEPTLLDPSSGLLVLAFHSLVITTPRHVILVDTCSGNDRERPGKPRYHRNDWPYLANLANAGVSRNQSTTYCAHTCMWTTWDGTRDGLMADGYRHFPTPAICSTERSGHSGEQEYTTERFTDDPYYEDSILPVLAAGQVDFVEGEHIIDDWVRLEPSYGHTPGHICVRVRSGDAELVMSGDLMHHALQCAEPQLSSCFCVDPTQSHHTRRAFLERHAETDTLIMPAHFPTPTAGRIRSIGDAFRFAFVT